LVKSSNPIYTKKERKKEKKMKEREAEIIIKKEGKKTFEAAILLRHSNCSAAACGEDSKDC
jgi:hypothetical protein